MNRDALQKILGYVTWNLNQYAVTKIVKFYFTYSARNRQHSGKDQPIYNVQTPTLHGARSISTVSGITFCPTLEEVYETFKVQVTN